MVYYEKEGEQQYAPEFFVGDGWLNEIECLCEVGQSIDIRLYQLYIYRSAKSIVYKRNYNANCDALRLSTAVHGTIEIFSSPTTFPQKRSTRDIS